MTFVDGDKVSDTTNREDRRSHLVRGTMRLADQTVLPIVVRNISARGLGVNCKDKPPARGQAVVITLPGSPDLDGVVRWVRGSDFGVRLSDAVDIEQLAAAIRREMARLKEEATWKVASLHRVHTPHATGPRRPI